MVNLREFELEEALYRISLLTQQHLPFSPEYQKFKNEVLEIVDNAKLRYMRFEQ